MDLATVGPIPPSRGGVALFTSELVRHLRRRHTVELYSFRRQYPAWLFPGNAAPTAPAAAAEPVSSRPTLDGCNPLSWRRTAAAIVAERPELLILQWWTPFWLPLYLGLARRARAAGIPVLTIAHQLVEPDASFAEWFVARTALRRSDGLVLMSEEELAMARRVLPQAALRLASLPALQGPAADDPDRGEARRLLGVDGDGPLLLFFGFVRRYKGLPVLLEALARVPRVRLLVAGEFWENEQPYRDRMQRLGIAERVTVVNRYLDRREVAACFRAADAVVLPYLAGNQSAVGATALAFGVPVIATTVGGLPELLRNGEAGLLVPPASPSQLAAAIARLLDGGLADRFRAAIAGSGEHHGWRQLVGVIEELAAELARPAAHQEGP